MMPAHINELTGGLFLIAFVACDRLIKGRRSDEGKLPKAKHKRIVVVAALRAQARFLKGLNVEATMVATIITQPLAFMSRWLACLRRLC